MTSEVSEQGRTLQASAVRLRLESLADNVMLVRQAVDGAARRVGASEEVIDDLKLAVTEACSNVVKYAYRDGSGMLEVTFDPVDGGFAVCIRDEGSWLERDGAGETGGLGIPLMEAVTRSCEIDSSEGGTTVRLEFPLERLDQEPIEVGADA